MGLLGSSALAATASAQSTLHYWDFSTQDDSVGGLISTAVGTPDRSVHATYGEAYPGSGSSLNTVWRALGPGFGGGVLDADVYDSGAATAMDFGGSNFSFSYWIYDDFAGDGDGRGPRVFDFLGTGLTEGIQLASNAAGIYNLRLDDDSGGSVLSNTTQSLVPPQDEWVHIAVNVDRVNDTVTVYVNGTSGASYSIAALSGGIAPSQDLRIGAINFGAANGEAQNQGLDDLAFYDELLTPTQLTDLAAGTITPLDLAPSTGHGSMYCTAEVNTTGFASSIFGTGDIVAANNAFGLLATGLPEGEFGYFIGSFGQAQVAMPGGSSGNLCVGGGLAIARFLPTLGAITGGQLAGSVDLTNVPLPPTFSGMIMGGDTFNFQLWHREGGTLSGMSNFSPGLEVTFQ